MYIIQNTSYNVIFSYYDQSAKDGTCYLIRKSSDAKTPHAMGHGPLVDLIGPMPSRLRSHYLADFFVFH
jgi:hypothetical protein